MTLHCLIAMLIVSLDVLGIRTCLQPNGVDVLAGGLASIPEACEKMKRGEVSGKKFIVRPRETV